MKQVGNTILAKGVNHILAKRDNSAWPKGAKLSGFSTKQWDATIPYIEQNRLAPWTHNKTIQKAIESYRITPEQKEYMRTLKIK